MCSIVCQEDSATLLLLQMKHCKIKSMFFFSTQQLICEFLALKNDISSWRKKKSMVGMSRKSGKKIIKLYRLDFWISLQY